MTNTTLEDFAKINNQTLSAGVGITNSAINTNSYKIRSNMDIFEEEFEEKYKVKFSDFIETFLAEHPELKI